MSLMCHEVRTPLNGCLASAEMLLETVLQVTLQPSSHCQQSRRQRVMICNVVQDYGHIACAGSNHQPELRLKQVCGGTW